MIRNRLKERRNAEENTKKSENKKKRKSRRTEIDSGLKTVMPEKKKTLMGRK